MVAEKLSQIAKFAARDIWLRNLHRETPRDRGYTYVCGAHFTPDCFEAST